MPSLPALQQLQSSENKDGNKESRRTPSPVEEVVMLDDLKKSGTQERLSLTPAAGSGRKSHFAKRGSEVGNFDDCLRLVAKAHNQELKQLSALRAENDMLRRRLNVRGTLIKEHSLPRPGNDPPTLLPGTPQQDFASSDDILHPMPVQPSNALVVDGASPQEKAPGSEPEDDEEHAATSQGLMENHRTSVTSTCSYLRFPLQVTWQQAADVPTVAANTSVRRHLSHILAPDADLDCEAPDLKQGRGIERFISYPSSPGRLLWDLIGALLILYDLLAIPIEAFDPPRTAFVIFMDWYTLVFWTANMPLSLQVGFVRKGATIMDFRLICINYLRTWFIIDMIVVLPDWIFTLVSLGSEDSSSSASSTVKLLRTLRLVRMVRLLRLLKLRQILSSLSDLIETEFTAIFANIFKMILLLLVINHYIGCLWWIVGTSQDGDETWVRYHGFAEVQWGYQYLTSFHWAITQFTPSSMHVQPQNPTERAVAILVVVFALVGFSYVVGSITGSLTQLRSMQEEAHKQFWIVRRYLKTNHVPLALSGRIQRYLEHAWNSQRQTLNLTNSKLFGLLSEQLQSELQYEISLPFLQVHELFAELSFVSGMTMRRVAWTAMSRKLLAQGDHLFIPQETATHMYILVSGVMDYIKTDLVNEDSPIQVDNSEDFISEPVLWTPCWVHLGALTARIESEVLMLDPKRFSDIVNRSPPAVAATVQYASTYLEQLNSEMDYQLSDINRSKSRNEGKSSVRTQRGNLVLQALTRQSRRSRH